MKMKKRTRYFIFLICILFAGLFLMPTIRWYILFSPEEKKQARLEGEKLKKEINKIVSESLVNLEDGKIDQKELNAINKEFIKEIKSINRVIEQENRDTKKLIEDQKKYGEDSTGDEYKTKEKIKLKKKYTYTEIKKILIQIKQTEEEATNFIRNILEDYYVNIYGKKKKVKNDIIKLGLDLQGGAYAVVTLRFDHPKVLERYPKKDFPNGIPKAEKDAMIDSAILKIENRINKYGLSETSIQKLKEQEKIIIYMPGVKEVTELRQIIETVGVLEFKTVSKEGSSILHQIITSAEQGGKIILDKDKKLLPEYQMLLEQSVPDVEALFIANRDKWGLEKEDKRMIAVKKESLLGENVKITSASVQPNQLGNLGVNFELGAEDAEKWSEVTEVAAKNQDRIAIILDDVVLTYPYVQEKIPNGRSRITLGDTPREELETLSIILRSGSMEVPLEISEQNTVGPSLGRDTIQKGLSAILYGFIFVLIFMIIWYSFGGVIADLAMILNLILLTAGMDMFNATLSLPGIAGVLLTIGMAVDANVIIYERIKEEYKSGKTFKTSVGLGFNKAFWTILDANLTTFFAGIGLTLFGTGPLKGFAVTLCMGIVTSVFTSLFVSRLIFDSLLTFIEFKSLRILSVRAFFRGNRQ